jgi:hypothetical protein
MDGVDRGRRLGSFLLGGIVGASAAIATGRRRRPRRRPPRQTTLGLAAFEGAPCYREIVQREQEEELLS